MSNHSPITPSPELVKQWLQEHWTNYDLARQAAQWGADQELEACCEWFQEFYKTESWVKHDLKHFRAARRPKPPSLKEQALRDLDALAKDLERNGMVFGTAMIRRALEALDD